MTDVAATGAGNLDKIEHIVVLMLENRSFDHMLGYLSLKRGRGDVDGLTPEIIDRFANEYNGHRYAPHHLERKALTRPEDPDHSGAAVIEQIGDDTMLGFVSSFAKKIAGKVRDPDPGVVMGYYKADDVYVYDHLAEYFLVCDRWHSSVPGATWPNRLYSICGRADGSRDDRPHREPPLYDKPSFVRHLDAHDITWRWYSYDPGTLRCADAHYLVGHHDNFAYVEKTKLSWKTEIEEEVVIDEESSSFLEDAAAGALPQVAWIDPNFDQINVYGSNSNDDHPPSDITDGQELVLLVYHALATSPQWEKTLLLITYDEHGGFFDHVVPPAAVDDDEAKFGRYGVRVPAIVVSPYVQPRAVAKDDAGASMIFDHTSIIKTILLKFCAGDLAKRGPQGLLAWLDFGHPHYLGKRAAEANNLGALLTVDKHTPRPAPNHDALLERAAERAAQAARARVTAPIDVTAPRQPLTDLQISIAHAAKEMRAKGLPPGQP
jgi:phospholipase C